MTGMKQLGLGLNLSTKKTRKREFLEEMERVVPWTALLHIIEPHCPRAKTGRPPFAVEQCKAHFRFEPLHLRADGSLGQTDPVAGSSEGAFLGDGDQRFQLTDH